MSPQDNLFGDNIEIKSYRDYCQFIKGHTSKSLRKFYDRFYFERHVGSIEFANLYFKSKGLASTRYTRLPIELANIQPGNRVLDVGCGRGEIVFQTANLGAFSTGIDYSVSAIDIALNMRKQHCEDIRCRTNFVCGNAVKMEFKDNYFDKVFLLDVIDHVSKSELYSILQEIKRVIKKHGTLIIHSSSNIWTRTYGYWLSSLINLLLRKKKLIHPIIASFQQLKSDPNYDEKKLFLHINEQSFFSFKLTLNACGFKNKVWLHNSGNPWLLRRDIKGRILSAIFRAIGLRYILGSDFYAFASPR